MDVVDKVIAGGGLLLLVLGSFSTIIWRSVNIRDAVVKEMQRVKDDLSIVIGSMRTSLNGEIAMIRKEISDRDAALRDKISDVEIWNRDNFVRRDSFMQTMDRFERNNAEQFKEVKKSLDRLLDDKIEESAEEKDARYRRRSSPAE
jgi:hypothetical protein